MHHTIAVIVIFMEFLHATSSAPNKQHRAGAPVVSPEKATEVAEAELARRNVDRAKLEPHWRGPMSYSDLLRESNDAVAYREADVQLALSGHTFWIVVFTPPHKPRLPSEPYVLHIRATWAVYVDAETGKVLYVEEPRK